MADERDRLGDKFRDVEAAREDQWARKRDAELLEKMRQKSAVKLVCPQCKTTLVPKVEGGAAHHACPNGHGAWFDAAALKSLFKSAK